MKVAVEVMHIQTLMVQLHQLVIGLVQIDIGITEVPGVVQLKQETQLN